MMKKKHCGILQITEEMKADKETKHSMYIHIGENMQIYRQHMEII